MREETNLNGLHETRIGRATIWICVRVRPYVSAICSFGGHDDHRTTPPRHSITIINHLLCVSVSCYRIILQLFHRRSLNPTLESESRRASSRIIKCNVSVAHQNCELVFLVVVVEVLKSILAGGGFLLQPF